MIIEKNDKPEPREALISTRVTETIKKSLEQEAKDKNYRGAGGLVAEILKKYVEG